MESAVLEQIAACGAELPSATIADIAYFLRHAGNDSERLPIHRRLQPAARASFDRLYDAWIGLHGGDRFGELAAALEAAAYQAVRQRALGAVELVWTGPSSPTGAMRGTEQVILDVIRNARTSLDIVVFAAYKVPALSQAVEQAFQRGVRVRFVLESKEESEGKITFDATAALGLPGGQVTEVYVWPQSQRKPNDKGQRGALHAKFIVADGSTLFVSSANLTEHAMSLNLELGVLIRGGVEPARATAMIDSLIQRGVLVRVT